MFNVFTPAFLITPPLPYNSFAGATFATAGDPATGVIRC